ncbi:helveticin J family class III bacteriocin [Lactobacillus sp. ESL0791]|uniref:helveticin J family class III bacteriocin n=1 Tax=Lactobacillus sp. ESL0791 TaxID=2983234 RepID=UPI0023F74972|nr:helveticin J family class III bacteriocin [Lactobacillus sp. ESL0791]MDF7639975.1 helveticin J family class III bacteriocin [Lactobacillus sp. ESL0791]
MKEYPKISLLTEISGGYDVVIQASNIANNNIYALQLRSDQQDTYVIKGSKTSGKMNKMPRLVLSGTDNDTAGGITQTLKYTGNNSWFIGTNQSANGYDIEIAQVCFPVSGRVAYHSHKELPRLSYLNRAGQEFGLAYNDKNIKHVEAAVSPDYQELLIASVDKSGNGYFSIYDMNEVSSVLDEVNVPGTVEKDVMITELSCKYAPNSPMDTREKRNVIEIPWNYPMNSWPSNPDSWKKANFSEASIDISGYISEFKSIQVTDYNMYLTVSYHNKLTNLKADKHRIYKIEWN